MTVNTPTKPKRRFLRFSLRTFLLVVVVASVAFGWLGANVKRARDQSLQQRVDQLLRAEPEQVRKLLPKIMSYSWVVLQLESVLSPETTLPAATADRHRLFCRQSNAAVALTTLGRNDKVWRLFKHSADPTPRSYLIHRYATSGGDPGVLLARLDKESDTSIRRAMILALGEFDKGQVSDADAFITSLLTFYEHDPDAGVHGATDWALRRWQREGWLTDEDQEQWHTVKRQLAIGEIEGGRNWYLTNQGLTMSVVEGGEFWYGDPPQKRNLNQRFAISTTEVTVEQFRRFLRATGRTIQTPVQKPIGPRASRWNRARGGEDVLPAAGGEDVHGANASLEDDYPVDLFSWYLPAEYCNWLTDQRNKGRSDNEQLKKCYEPNTDGYFDEGMTLHPKRNGYRLPTEVEWEFACRAGSRTDFSFGDARELMVGYGHVWYAGTPCTARSVVARYKPNDFGLFDMHGNIWEWCHKDSAGTRSPESHELNNFEICVLRGGSFFFGSVSCQSGFRWELYNKDYDFAGFRVARTYE